jgi:hypothetical protein
LFAEEHPPLKDCYNMDEGKLEATSPHLVADIDIDCTVNIRLLLSDIQLLAADNPFNDR